VRRVDQNVEFLGDDGGWNSEQSRASLGNPRIADRLAPRVLRSAPIGRELARVDCLATQAIWKVDLIGREVVRNEVRIDVREQLERRKR
jgi:hypothetical protein